MSIAPRIDELRKKFEENPRRYFAPLANELRKAGDLAQAIALCREHLPKQPGHMSGHIVFGQALYESGELDEGRGVFEQALALDPENLIALRHLGDIARQLGDAPAARRWYERVLEADPRNDDIAAQLATLSTGTPVRVDAVPAPEPIPEPTEAPPAPIAAEARAPDPIDLDEFDELDVSPELPALSAFLSSATVPSVSDDAPVFFDLDAIEAAADEVAAIEGAAEKAASDPFFGSSSETPADEAVTAGHTEGEESFEEGLVAAEWPDTSDLAARAATPRSVTPAFVEVSADAADAFGREPDDAVVAGIPEPEPDLVEAVVELATGSEEDEAPAPIGDLTGGIQVANSILAFEEDTTAGLVAQYVELGSSSSRDDLPLDETAEFPVAETSVAETALAEHPVVESTAAEGESELEWISPPVATHDDDDEHEPAHNEAVGVLASSDSDDDEPVAVFDDAESEPLGVAEADTDDAELPWLAAPVTPDEDVGAIVEAFAEDARAKGEADDVSVIAMPEPTAPEPVAAAQESSFAGVMDGSEVEAYEEAEQEASQPASVGSAPSAFVTETMGELLVAQGFTERAISVFEELVRRRPDDPAPASRLAELRAQIAAPVALQVATPTPLAQAAITRTARERFAALAARRVDRRTPAYAMQSVTPDYSLASLFGNEPAPHEDQAAQAFASAFSTSGHESTSDSFFGSGSMTAVREPTPAHVQSVPIDAAGGAYAFDRFFPDPATARPSSDSVTPVSPAAEPSTPTSSAATEGKAADDLAQFSAWLKGLGNP